MNHLRWNLRPRAPAECLSVVPGLSPLVAQLLYNRGLREPSQMDLFLNADERLSYDPFLLPNMHQAVARVYRALLSGEKIAVYGDFDVDGITGTALLVRGLSALGAQVVPYIPHRISEGHGLRITALEELRQQGVSLILTVDCGITDLPEVQKANKLGLEVVITDHHTCPEELPQALAIVNPKLPGSLYPFTELAGVGVGYKLLQALYKSIGKDGAIETVLDLVAIGTIADMVPLVGENRYLVKKGLKIINASPRLGIREIFNLAGLTPGNLESDSISWCLAPWLNASGRLEHAGSSYKLLITDSLEEAHSLAVLLGQKNQERQRLTSKVLSDAREQILATGVSSLLIVADKDYPLGIAGPVASKLSDEFYRPVIVVRTDEKTCSGSCRSIPEFNIILALNKCSDLLGRFGGHSQAAGFTVPTQNLARLRQSLSELADSQLAGVDLRPHLDIDAEVTLSELDWNTYQLIQKLSPFGKGNPFPIFLSRKVEVLQCRTMGNGREHLKLRLKQGTTPWDGVAFRLGDSLGEISSFIDIVYNLEIDRWNGTDTLRLNILGFNSSESNSN